MVRGPQLVLEVCPCGPSKKIEVKLKFKLISYHTLAENIKSLEITHGNRLSAEYFPDDEAVEREITAWFRQQPKEFYAAGFQGLVK
jgi:hypothetical protein